MPDYFVFGGCLRSELPFPELAEARGLDPSWTLQVQSLPEISGEVLGDVALSASCRMRVTRAGERLRYAHSCTGVFEVAANGRTIVFDPAPGADLDVARTDLVSRVLLMCVDQEGVAWLHGSAVAIGSRAIGFLGPSGAGKSTMSLALARAGARHICDDTLPVECGVTTVVWPSDHTLRLREDSRALLAGSAHAVRRDSDGKFVVTHDALAALATPAIASAPASRYPVDALYLLQPPPPPTTGDEARPGTVATRRRLAPVVIVPALMAHLKLGPVVRDGAPMRALRQLGALANNVPVYELRVTRDWSRLDELVAQVLAWHRDTTAPFDASAPAKALA